MEKQNVVLGKGFNHLHLLLTTNSLALPYQTTNSLALPYQLGNYEKELGGTPTPAELEALKRREGDYDGDLLF